MSSHWAALCRASWRTGASRAEANAAARETDLEEEREQWNLREEEREYYRRLEEEDRRAFERFEEGDAERDVIEDENRRYWASRYPPSPDTPPH